MLRVLTTPVHQAWASSISATIFQNRLQARLPTAFLDLIPAGQDVTYSGIPLIPSLAPELQDTVRSVFAESIRLVWYISLGLCAAGFASVAVQKHVPLHTKMDNRFGMKGPEKGAGVDAEKAPEASDVSPAENAEGPERGAPVEKAPGAAVEVSMRDRDSDGRS